MAANNEILERAPTRADDPAENAIAFTGTADVDLTMISRGIYIASDGDIKVDFAGGVTNKAITGNVASTAITFVGVKGGSILPIMITKIYDSGTTVSGLILL